MSRRMDCATNALLVFFFIGAIYIVFPLDDFSRQTLSDFRPFAGVVFGIGVGITIQRILNRMRR